MRSSCWVSNCIFTLIGSLAFQITSASPPDSVGTPESTVITQEGFVKLRSELDSNDKALPIIPLTSTDDGTLTVGRGSAPCAGGVGGDQLAYGSPRVQTAPIVPLV